MRALILSSTVPTGHTTRLKELLGSYPDLDEPTVASFENLETECLEAQPDLVVLSLCENPRQGHEAIRRLRAKFKGDVLVVGEAADPKAILDCLKLGANHFVDVAELDVELHPTLRRLWQKAEAVDRVGDLVAVLSASGGCGASTLATNLAALAARRRGQCALLDLNGNGGDLAGLLNLKPQFSFADVCLNLSRLDQTMLFKMLAVHPSGIHLLASPPDFMDVGTVTVSGVKAVLSLTRALFPETVADLEDAFHDEQVAVLREATRVFLVTRLVFTSLRHARHLLEHLAGLDIPRDRVRVIANQYGEAGAVPLAEAEDALGVKIAHAIPHDPQAMNGGNNAGQPMALVDENSKAARAIRELARAGAKGKNGHHGLVGKVKEFLAAGMHRSPRPG